MSDLLEHGLTLEVVERSIEADRVVSLVLAAPDRRPLPRWTPGSHIELQLGEGILRQYSLCGELDHVDRWTVAVLREDAGRGGSAKIHADLHPGSQVRVTGLRNLFEMRPAERYMFIAGGIGITPFLSMAQTAQADGAEWQLLYGGRSKDAMAFADMLRERYGDRVVLHPEDTCGLPDLDSLLATPRPGTLVYCCGPGGLLEAVEARCAEWPSGSLHIERFHASPVVREAPDLPFEVVLGRSGPTVPIPTDRSIVDVLREDHGIDLPTSCEEGICGTCETTVLDGEPDHRDHVLSDEERKRGDTMMPCVSRARGPRLVLDL